jgi:hypothetical protein
MHIASALRRKRDEIVATIAVYEARIDAARMDLAALDQAARLFDPEAGRDAAAINPEFGGLGKPEEIPAAQCEAWELERPSAMGQLTLPCAKPQSCDDTPPFKSIGVRKGGFAEWVAHATAQTAGEQIPAEFFYLNWP